MVGRTRGVAACARRSRGRPLSRVLLLGFVSAAACQPAAAGDLVAPDPTDPAASAGLMVPRPVDFPATFERRGQASVYGPQHVEARPDPAVDYGRLAEPTTYGLHWSGTETAAPGDYDFDRFRGQVSSVSWDIAAIGVGITVLGIYGWDWGSSGYHFTSEGFFGEDTFNGGMDKLGHFYTTYVLTEYFTYRIRNAFGDAAGAEYTAAALSLGFMTYVEIFDGFAEKHGFSYQDIIMNTAGAAFSILRNRVPGLAEKVDFRLQWMPSDTVDWVDPATDYMGQKYVLALKPAGFDLFRETPLRFTELHVGYYARGFKQGSEGSRERNLYVGVGLNLAEIYNAVTRGDDSTPSRIVKTGLEYVQVPYTYVPLEQRF